MSDCQGFWIQQKLDEQEKKLNRRLDDLERILLKLKRQVEGVDVVVSAIHREMDGPYGQAMRDLADKARVWTE